MNVIKKIFASIWRRKWLALLVVAVIVFVIILSTGKTPVPEYSYSRNLWISQTSKVSPQPGINKQMEYRGKLIDDDGIEVVPINLSNPTAMYTANIEKAGFYYIYLYLRITNDGLNPNNFSISVNNNYIDRVAIRTLWRNETNSFDKDARGNDIMPIQLKYDGYQDQYITDYINRYNTPIEIWFEAGVNDVIISLVEGSFNIAYASVVSIEKTVSYDEYISNAQTDNANGEIILEAQQPYYKNSTALYYTNTTDVNVTPYETNKSLLNTALMYGCDESEAMFYKLEISSSGYYKIGINYRNGTTNQTCFYNFLIDGVAPFGELYNYPLFSNKSFEMHFLGDSYSQPFRIYLTEGQHLLSINACGAAYADSIESLENIINELSDIYLSLRVLSVQQGDTDRQWTPEEDYPGVVDKLTLYRQQLDEICKQMRKINGLETNFQATVFIDAAVKSLDNLLKKPNYIPNNNALLAEGSGSISMNISSAINQIKSEGIAIDKFTVSAYKDNKNYPSKSGWVGFSEGVKRFFSSFFIQQNTKDKDALEVWVNLPNFYIDMIQNMSDTAFTKDTGIKVNYYNMPNESKLILNSAAGNLPDAVFGISNWLPYELGIRSLTYDIRKFNDYNSVISRFSAGALIPLVADGIGLGLPETQDFYVTYYRKDIFEKYGFSVPDTWDDVIALMSQLQRFGMNFYIPLSTATASKSLMTTAPFIQQNGGSLYSEDAMSTAIDSEKSLEAIKLMTNFYLSYGMPVQVANFFNSFRNGSLPIGVSTLDTYIRMMYSAPELVGKWGIALSPGIRNENGEVERWQAGSSTSCIMMKDGKNINGAWELLKWWTRADTQTAFSNNLRKTYGTAYIYNSANLEAFSSSSIPQEDKEVILQQWEWMQEYCRIPGWYMVERELSNSWNRIVLGGELARTVIDEAVVTINKEILRKLTEFGYINNGVVVKQYKITTIEEIRQWQQ